MRFSCKKIVHEIEILAGTHHENSHTYAIRGTSSTTTTTITATEKSHTKIHFQFDFAFDLSRRLD